MKRLLGLILGIFINLSTASPVLANGDVVHLGEFHLPTAVFWIGGAIIVLIFLFLFISWRNSRKARAQLKGEGGRDEK